MPTTRITSDNASTPNQLVLTADERFSASASPAEWSRVALELRYSAKMLWAHQHLTLAISNTFDTILEGRSMVSRPSFLLYGLAIENMLKALGVASDPTLIAGGELDTSIKSHKLAPLAATVGIVLDHDETALCNMVSEADVYWGRYPIPLKMTHLADEKALAQAMIDDLDRLFTRLGDELIIKLSGGWDSGNGIRIIHFEKRNDRFYVHYEIDVASGKSGLAFEFGPPA